MSVTIAIAAFFTLQGINPYHRTQTGFAPLLGTIPNEASTDRMPVVDAFYYGCPFCNEFAPKLAKWAAMNADTVDLKYLPVGQSPSQRAQGTLFFVLTDLGLLSDMHARAFSAIHKEGTSITTVREARGWAEREGIPKELFNATLSRGQIDARLDLARDIARSAHLGSVPALVVDRKWVVTPETAGSQEAMISTLEVLRQEWLVRRADRLAKRDGIDRRED